MADDHPADDHQSSNGPGGVFRRVLVGFDGSEEARRALGIAIALVADLHGEVHVLLVVRPPAHSETPEELARAEEAERDNLSAGLAGVQNQTRHTWAVTTDVVFADDPAAAIARHAADHGFDLIVVGDRGREKVTHRGIGHSLEALLLDHPCPVLVV
jgi:nucleotide-binding universal stress UspA family protein